MPQPKGLISSLWNGAKDKLLENAVTLLSLFGGSGMTIFAAVSKLTTDYGPVMWGAIGIGAALVISLIGLIISLSITKLSESRYFESVAAAPTNVNPLMDNFDHQRVRLSDLYGPKVMFHRKVFRNCEIIGPGAITILDGCHLNGINFSQCDLVIVRDGDMVFSAIGFADSSFFNCEIFKVTIFLPQIVAEAMVRDAQSRGDAPPMLLGLDRLAEETESKQG